MEGKSNGMETLRYCVMSHFNDLGYYNAKQYNRFLQMAVEAYRELNLTFKYMPESISLTIPDSGVLNMPRDMVDYIRICINVGGSMYELTRNNSLILPRGLNEGGVANVQYADLTGYNLADVLNEYPSYTSPHHYGSSGGKNVGYYRIDDSTRQIVLSGFVPGAKLVIDYISTGINMNGKTYVPIDAVIPIKAYIAWKSIEHDKSYPRNEKDMKMMQWNVERRVLISKKNAFTINEFLDAMYSVSKQTIKR